MQSVPIATKVVSSKFTHCEMYWIQHYLIKFVSDLQRSLFSLETLVSSTNKTDLHDITEILLKVALNTIPKTSFPLKLLCQLEPNFIGMIYMFGTSSTNIPHFILVGHAHHIVL